MPQSKCRFDLATSSKTATREMRLELISIGIRGVEIECVWAGTL